MEDESHAFLPPDGAQPGRGTLSRESEAPKRATVAPAVAWWRETYMLLWNAIDGLINHDGINVASMIAFTLTFAIFPFMIFLAAVAAYIGGPDLAHYLSQMALTVLPDHVVRTFQPELTRVLASQGSGTTLLTALAVTLVSITGAVEALRDGLNRAYGCLDNRTFYYKRLHSLVFVFFVVVLLILLGALAVALPVYMTFVKTYVPNTWNYTPAQEMGRQMALIIVLIVLLGAIHLFLPARHRKIRMVIVGVLVTLFGWWVSGKAFGFYLARFADYSAYYASLAGIIATMFFLYIVAIVFQFGAELNRAIAERVTGENLCKGKA